MLMLSFNVTAVFLDGQVGMDNLSKPATSKHKNEPPSHFQKRGMCRLASGTRRT